MAEFTGDSEKPKSLDAVSRLSGPKSGTEVKSDPLDEARLPMPSSEQLLKYAHDSYWQSQAAMHKDVDHRRFMNDIEQANREIDRKDREFERQKDREHEYMLASLSIIVNGPRVKEIQEYLRPTHPDVPYQIVMAAIDGKPQEGWTAEEKEQYQAARFASNIIEHNKWESVRTRNYPRCKVDGGIIYPPGDRDWGYRTPKPGGYLGTSPFRGWSGLNGYPYTIVPYKANPLAGLKKPENTEK